METMLIECDNISKSFGGLQALDEVDLSVDTDEIVGLIGPNGAGKTTLFNVMTGIYAPNGGSVTLGGEEIVGWKPYEICQHGVARSFQTPQPLSSLTIEENVKAADHFGRVDREQILSISEILKMFDLWKKRDLMPDKLQLIEKKKLDLARALATAPKLIFLDEIMAGLTPTEKTEIIDQIIELHEMYDISFLVIEHDLKVVRDLCDRVVVINEGSNIASGSASEVFDNQRVQETYIGGSA